MSAETHQQSTGATDARESQRGAPVPLWLIILFGLLVYWAAVYFDQNSGWFSPKVYAPYRTVEEVNAFQPSRGAAEEMLMQGKLIFQNCSVCHLDSGAGDVSKGCPPLVGSEWIKTAGPGRIVRIVSKGLTGPIQVKGQPWGSGTMVAVGDALLGDEDKKSEQIAAVVNYVRHTFGDEKLPLITPAQVKAIREEIKGHPTNYHSEELLQVPEDK